MPSRKRILNAYSGCTYCEALLTVKRLDVVIVSAFGRSDEVVDVLRTLSLQNRSVTLLVGTQNCFTSARFIEACSTLALELKNFEFFVDFRVSESIHYKLVLAGRNEVILGSSNFTKQGLKGEMDLMGRFVDKKMVAEVAADLARIRAQPGVLNSSAPTFVAALKRYANAAANVADLGRQVRKAGSDQNPFKKVAPPALTLAEWLGSDDAEAIRIFGYKEDLDQQQKKADVAARADAKEQNRRITGLISYCPQKAIFEGVFLEVNGKNAKSKVFATKVEFAGKFRNRFIVLGRRQKIESLGFSPTPEEAAALARVALKKSEGRLSVREMRRALGTPSP